ncbi:MAG: DEAD/DEAH box helicase [Spirochaetales bacterium]|nr:DEAD/DEAH box helicase [Spirochaetales bacterium]
MKFEEFNLHEDIMRGVTGAGFTEAMPAQERTFKAVFSGKDVTVQSQTGTGKTAAFLISIYQLFMTNAIENKKALIVVPTRELAVQIEEESAVLGANLPFKTVSIYGGVGYKEQLDKLKAGADLIVGTPGRLLDLEKSNNIDYKQFGVLVIDEADRLFDMGFFPDLKKMLRRLPDRDFRRTMLFSATLNTRVLNLAWDQMNEYEEIKIEPDKMTVEEITQELFHVAGHEKFRLLLGILKRDKFDNVIVFCNTKHMAVEVSKRLEINGYKTKFLMGDLPQNQRLSVINNMKAGELDILVATDVAARGLHVDDLSMVVNYDLPEDYENYVHRIGRTARAGKSGRAVTLACEKYVYHLPAIESFIGDKISVIIADEELFAEDASAGMRFRNEYSDDRPSRGRSDNRQGSRGGPGQGNGSGGGGGRRDGRKDYKRDDKPRGNGADKPDGRKEYKRDDKSGVKPESRPDNRPSGKPDSRPDNRPSSKPDSRPDSRPNNRPSGKPDIRPESRPSGRPDSRPNNRPSSRPDSRPSSRPDSRPDSRGSYDRSRPDSRDAGKSRPYQNVKKPVANSSVEDRMAYYKAKYGEDFKPSADMLKQAGTSGRNGGKKAGSRGGANKQNSGGAARNQAVMPGKGKAQQSSPLKEKAKTEPEKKGFLSKLFGKKNK